MNFKEPLWTLLTDSSTSSLPQIHSSLFLGLRDLEQKGIIGLYTLTHT